MRQIIRCNDALVSCTSATRRISGEGKDRDGAGGLAMVGAGGLAMWGGGLAIALSDKGACSP